jgi:hypothetical protein
MGQQLLMAALSTFSWRHMVCFFRSLTFCIFSPYPNPKHHYPYRISTTATWVRNQDTAGLELAITIAIVSIWHRYISVRGDGGTTSYYVGKEWGLYIDPFFRSAIII